VPNVAHAHMEHECAKTVLGELTAEFARNGLNVASPPCGFRMCDVFQGAYEFVRQRQHAEDVLIESWWGEIGLVFEDHPVDAEVDYMATR
jgi:hypothetical protein